MRRETRQPSGASAGGGDMRLIIATAILCLATGLAIASDGEAQKPPKPGGTTLKASAKQVTFSSPVTLSGKVKGAKQAMPVTLERRAADSAVFVAAGTATSDVNGDFAFVDRP